MTLAWEAQRRVRAVLQQPAQPQLVAPAVHKEIAPRTIRASHLVFEPPKVDFPTMFDWAESNGTVRDISNYIADQVISNGITVDYNEEAGDKGEEAKKAVDDLFEDIGIDDLAWDVAKWGYLVGNVFLFDKNLFMSEKKLEILPVDSIFGMKREQDSKGYTSLKELYQTFDYGAGATSKRTLKGSQLIHFRMGLDNTSGFGSGIMQTLLASQTITLRDEDATNTETIVTAPLIYIITLLMHDIYSAYHTYAKPKRLVIAENAPDTAMNTLRNEWKKPGDVLINYPGDLKNATVEPGLRWAAEITFLENRFIEIFGMPYNKLFTTPGFTEASARVAKLIADRRVARIQRWEKRGWEREVINPFLESKSFDVKTVDNRVNFGGLDRPEWRISDILSAGGINPNAISRMTASELRAFLRSIGWPLNPKNDKDFQDIIENPQKPSKSEQDQLMETWIETDGGRKFKITEKKSEN